MILGGDVELTEKSETVADFKKKRGEGGVFLIPSNILPCILRKKKEKAKTMSSC